MPRDFIIKDKPLKGSITIEFHGGRFILRDLSDGAYKLTIEKDSGEDAYLTLDKSQLRALFLITSREVEYATEG